MTTGNPFGLLDNDAEDPNQLAAAIPLKKVEKALAVQTEKEAQNGSGGGRGHGGGRRDGNGGGNRGRGGRFIRDNRDSDAPANENGYVNGGRYRRSEGDGARRGGPVGGYRGGRRGGYSNGDSGDFERPRRYYERHSGTGHGNEFKRDGAGGNNWGTTEDVIPPVNGESTTTVEKSLPVEKQGGEDEATDANKGRSLEEQEREAVRLKRLADREAEREADAKLMTLEVYEKVLEEKKKALQAATKVEERKVDTKAFDSMQQLSSKKGNNDDVFIKLGTEKDKRVVEKEEKTKKSLSIDVFLKPANGGRHRGGYQGGRGGRGPSNEGGRGGRQGGALGGDKAATAPKPAKPQPPAPKIEDTAQFPTLGK